MQCIIVKGGERCPHLSDQYGMLGITVPIIQPSSPGLFICIVCLDEMAFVAHQPEKLGDLASNA